MSLRTSAAASRENSIVPCTVQRVIVFATGYNIRFPFFAEPTLQPDAEHRMPLFKRIVKPGIDNLYYAGLAQAAPTIVNLAEQQSKLIARHITGRYVLPSHTEMNQVVARDERKHLGQYYNSPRHTIQVDFARYVRDLAQRDYRGRETRRCDRCQVRGGRVV